MGTAIKLLKLDAEDEDLLDVQAASLLEPNPGYLFTADVLQRGWLVWCRGASSLRPLALRSPPYPHQFRDPTGTSLVSTLLLQGKGGHVLARPKGSHSLPSMS